MNDLVIAHHGSIQAFEAYERALQTFAASGVDDMRPILKLDPKDGEWFFGQEKIYVEKDDLWAVNAHSVREGYIAFTEDNKIAETEDGEPAEIVTAPGCLPRFEDLPYLTPARREEDDPKWQKQAIIELVCVEGPNQGEIVKYATVSHGGKKFIRRLSGEIARHMRDEKPVPVIELLVDGYNHKDKKKGYIYTPEFKIVDWVAADATEFTSEREDDNERVQETSDHGNAREDAGSDDGEREASDNRNARRGSDDDERNEKVRRNSARESDKSERAPRESRSRGENSKTRAEKDSNDDKARAERSGRNERSGNRARQSEGNADEHDRDLTNRNRSTERTRTRGRGR